ncbi:MAG: YdcF family protein [Rhodospirillaceae bacterium]
MARRPRHGHQTGAGKFLVLILIMLAIWGIGLFQFAETIPQSVEDQSTKTDAIVVLTGGSGRLDAGLDLLARYMAQRLFVSGVYRGVDVNKLLEISKHRPRDVETRIAIGNAVNTAENAEETQVWMAKNAFKSLRLVTGAYHIPRSLTEFANAMPDVTVILHPVFPQHVKQDNWWAWPGTASLIVSEYNKWLFARLRHVLSPWTNGPAGGAAK